MKNSYLNSKPIALNHLGEAHQFVDQIPRRFPPVLNLRSDKAAISNCADVYRHGHSSIFNWQNKSDITALDKMYTEAKNKFDDCINTSVRVNPYHHSRRQASYLKFTLRNDSCTLTSNQNQVNVAERQKLVRKYLDETPSISRHNNTQLKLPELQFRTNFCDRNDLESLVMNKNRRMNPEEHRLILQKDMLPLPTIINDFNYISYPLRDITDGNITLELPILKTDGFKETNYNIHKKYTFKSNLPFVDTDRHQYVNVSNLLDRLRAQDCKTEIRLDHNFFDTTTKENIKYHKEEFVSPARIDEFKTEDTNVTLGTEDQNYKKTYLSATDRKTDFCECPSKSCSDIKQHTKEKSEKDTKIKDRNNTKTNKNKLKNKRLQKKYMMDRYLNSSELTERNFEIQIVDESQTYNKKGIQDNENVDGITTEIHEIDSRENKQESKDGLLTGNITDTSRKTEIHLIRNIKKGDFKTENLDTNKKPVRNTNNTKELDCEDYFHWTKSDIDSKDIPKENDGYKCQKKISNIGISLKASSHNKSVVSEDEFYDCQAREEENISGEFGFGDNASISGKHDPFITGTPQNHVATWTNVKADQEVLLSSIHKPSANIYVKGKTINTLYEPKEFLLVHTKEKFNKICEDNHTLLNSACRSSNTAKESPYTSQGTNTSVLNTISIHCNLVNPNRAPGSAALETRDEAKPVQKITRSIETQTEYKDSDMMSNENNVKIQELVVEKKSIREIGIGTHSKESSDQSHKISLKPKKSSKSLSKKFNENTTSETCSEQIFQISSEQILKDSSEQSLFKIILVKKVNKHGEEKVRSRTKSTVSKQKSKRKYGNHEKKNIVLSNKPRQNTKTRQVIEKIKLRSHSDESLLNFTKCSMQCRYNLNVLNKKNRVTKSFHCRCCCSSCESLSSVRSSVTVSGTDTSLVEISEKKSSATLRDMSSEDHHDGRKRNKYQMVNYDREVSKKNQSHESENRRSTQRSEKVRKISSKNVKWTRKENKDEIDEIDIALSYSSCTTTVDGMVSEELVHYKATRSSGLSLQERKSRMWETCDTNYLQMKDSKKWYHFCFKP